MWPDVDTALVCHHLLSDPAYREYPHFRRIDNGCEVIDRISSQARYRETTVNEDPCRQRAAAGSLRQLLDAAREFQQAALIGVADRAARDPFYRFCPGKSI